MTETDPSALIAARRATAEQTKNQTLTVIAAMIRRRETITFAAVATKAGVSREYLYRNPDLAARIRASRDATKPHALSQPSDTQPIVAALRDHIRRLEAQHAVIVDGLRIENQQLRRQLETALGQIIAEDRPARTGAAAPGEEMTGVTR